MSAPDLQMLENYLLLPQEEFMQKLIKGTDPYYFFTFLKLFTQIGCELTEEQKKQLQDYQQFRTQMSENIHLRSLFHEYDSLNSTPCPETDEVRKTIIQKIAKQLLNVNFDHQQPTRVATTNISGVQQQEDKACTLDYKLTDIKYYLEDAYTEIGFKKIPPNLYIHLDLEKLLKSHVNNVKAFMHNVGFEIVDFKGIPNFYNQVSQLKEFKSELNQQHFRKLSLTQLEELKELNPKFLENQHFIGEMYLKKFQYNLKDINYQQLSSDEKKKLKNELNTVYEWTKTLSPKFKSFNDQILFELLQVGIELNEYDFDLFKVYLQDPRELYEGATEWQVKNQKQNARSYQSVWHEYHKMNVNRWYSSNQLILNYLENYFENNDDVEQFTKYLDVQFLQKTKAQVKLYQGQELGNIYQYFSSSQIESMNNQKLITICKSNKLYFKHGEPAKVYVQLKNIPSLTIKVFEFNPENYYLQNFKELDPNVQLDGLISYEEDVFNYAQPPIVKIIKEFECDLITNKQRGIFIMEFIGNGITSRAIIKKGRLQLREKITPAGHAFQILDENFELCAGNKTGIWLDRKFYKVDERKEVLIPYSLVTQNFQAIVVHEDFAEITNVTIQKEHYELKCAFLVANEQMLMGSQAKTLIYPKLYVNNTETSLRLLQNPQVMVTSINDSDVPSTTPYENIKLLDNQPVEIQFPIPAKIKRVTIALRGKVVPMHKESTISENLESTHHIIFNTQEGRNVFTNQYLKYSEKQGYEIYLLGKNGEPKFGIDLSLTVKLLRINESFATTLRTDAQGKVSLGHLINVERITSNVRSVRDISADSKTWNIQQNQKLQYPKQIKVLTNEQLNLPYLYQSGIAKNISLVQVFEEGGRAVIRSLTDQLKLENNNLQIKFDQPGNYELVLLEQQNSIYINVLAGEKWKNTEIIKVKDTLIIDKSLEEQLAIKDVVKERTENSTKVKGTIISNRPSQIVAVAQTFNNDLDYILDQIFPILKQHRSEQLSINLYSSIFQSNKELSDEQKYVLNRKNQERYIGNTLEKPQILLKRQQIRETNTQNEQLSQEGQYSQQLQDQATRKMEKQRAGVNRQACDSRGQEVHTFQDFLRYPALLFQAQVQKDKQGEFEFEIPNHYSNVFLIAFTNSNLTCNTIGLDHQLIETRNLCHQSQLDKDKFYSIFRSNKLITEGETVQITDLTSTEIKLVDSLDKLFVLLKELRKAEGPDTEQENGFAHWEFLTKWHTNTIDQKHKQYDEHQCDELNIFIYFRDPAFFETYTKQYIQNKIERSFIDYFLLQDKIKLEYFAKPSQLIQLNALEITLLVIYFAEIQQNLEQAQQITQYVDNKNKLISVDQKKFKLLFDTALGAKTEGDEVLGEAVFDNMLCQQSAAPANIGQERFQSLGRTHQQQLMCMNMAAMPKARMMAQQRVMNQAIYNQQVEEEEQCSNDFFADDYDGESNYRSNNQYYESKREKFVESFKNIEKTKEYGEKHYCKTTQISQHRGLVSINGFWADLANHSLKKGVLAEDFLSQKFIYCNSNHTQMIAAMALLGLPNEAPVQDYKQFQGKGLEITVKKSAILFVKEIKEGSAQLRNDILVAQRFFDPQDRFQYSEEDPDLQLEKDISECLIDKIYGCQVIVTNCSSTRADYQVLIEVPNGAIPVNTVAYTKSYTVPLQPYSTQRLEYFFYFPKVGEYSVYPANVSRFGQVVCVAKESMLKVVTEKSVTNLEILDDILAKGSKDDILTFLSTKNIFNQKIFKIDEILYLFKDKEFYLKVIDILRKRKFINYSAWSYSIYHNDTQSLKEFFHLEQCQKVLKQRFKYFKCSLFEISNIRFYEYYPLITKRVHKLTSEAKGILNIEFKNQYYDFLQYLSQKHKKDVSDKLAFIYYLLLQERINEAIQIFQSITEPPKEGECQLQYDYFTAYLDFYIGYPNFIKARQICEKYINYPVIHWRNLFYEIVNQLSEYDGDDDENQKIQVEQTKQKKQQEQAKKEEILQSAIEGNQIVITYSNLQAVKIQFYKIDLEILFSRNPFLNQATEDFSYVLPNSEIVRKLQAEQQAGMTYKEVIEIPEDLRQNNLFIQIKGESKRSSNRYFSTSLNIQIMENYGQLRVSNSQGKYLSKIYVKAYIKEKNGTQSFYKDGYTDLRGRFDYASLSSSQLGNADSFSILVASDELGSVIKEVKAPSQVGQYENEVKLVSKAWSKKAEQEQYSQFQQYETSKNSTNMMRRAIY